MRERKANSLHSTFLVYLLLSACLDCPTRMNRLAYTRKMDFLSSRSTRPSFGDSSASEDSLLTVFSWPVLSVHTEKEQISLS